MAIIEQGKCRIKSINSRGLGEGQTTFGKVELPYTIEGEVVEFDRHKYRSNSSFILKSISEPSTNRIEPECKYFGACGGCLLQHLNPDTYQQFKYRLIKEALDQENISTNILPLVTIPSGQRRRATLTVIKKKEQVFLGFHRFHSHQIINIDECPALHSALSRLIPALKALCLYILIDSQKAKIFLTQGCNGIDLMMEFEEERELSQSQAEYLTKFANDYNIIRLSFRYNSPLRQVKPPPILVHQTAIPYINFDNVPVEIDADGFLQASSGADKILANLILQYITPSCPPSSFDLSSPRDLLVELFCGRGTFTIALSRYFIVEGFEADQAALKALGRAVMQAALPITLTARDLFTCPLNRKELGLYKIAVINPPRAGAKAQITELAKSQIKKIVYISCNPQTFAADAKILCDANYKLVTLTPVDQFYWNPHLEVAGLFECS